MTFKKAYEKFIDDRSVYCSDKTITAYEGHLGLFLKWLENTYGKSVNELDFEELPADENIYKNYILYLRNKKSIKNTSIRSYARHIKAFLHYLYEEDICCDYIKKVKLPKDDAALKMPLYMEEVRKIDNTFDRTTVIGKRNYCIVHLMLDCGLRTQEVCHLCPEHLERQRNLIRIIDSKENKSRIVLCPDFLFNAIENYQQHTFGSCPYLFRSIKHKNDPITENTVRLFFADLKKTSGVNRVHAHLLRHTFATSYLLGGGNLEFLRVFMGHYDYTVTKSYSSLAAQCKMLGLDIYKLDDIFFKTGY